MNEIKRQIILVIIIVISFIIFAICYMLIDFLRNTSQNFDFGVGVSFIFGANTVFCCLFLDTLVEIRKKRKNNEKNI